MKRRVAISVIMTVLLILAGCPLGSAQPAPPVLNSVAPNVIQAGSPTTDITLNGSGFKKPINVQWNNSLLLATNLVNSTKVVATVPASSLINPGTATVRALQGGGGNQTATASVSITIAPAAVAPTLTSISPTHGTVGTGTVVVTLTGTGFTSTSVVNLNGNAIGSGFQTFVNATTMTVTIGGAFLTSAQTISITVTQPGVGTSGAKTFTVVSILTITTTTLPGGQAGVAYSSTLAAAGGTKPYTWAITAGTLPAGLALASSTGVISGTPTAAGTSTFTVSCTDSSGTITYMTFPHKMKVGR